MQQDELKVLKSFSNTQESHDGIEKLMGLGRWSWDVKNNHIIYSENCTKMLGRDRGELDGPLEKLKNLMPVKNYELLENGYKVWFESGDGTYTRKYPLYNTKGEEIWFYEIADIIKREPDGKPYIIRGVLLNIDEAFKTQETLEEQNRLLQSDVESAKKTARAMFDANPQINLLIDDAMRIIDCNPAAVEFYGFSDETSFLSWVGDFSENADKIFGNILFEGRSAQIESMIDVTMRQGRSEFVCLFKDKPMMNVVMKRIDYERSYAIVIYINERSESDEYIQLMLDAMPMSCVLMDENFRVVDCNTRAVELREADSKEEVLNFYSDFQPKFQPNGSLSTEIRKVQMKEVLDKGYLKFKWTFQTKKGKLLPCEVTVVRVKWHDSYRIVVFANDIQMIEKEKEKASEAEAYTQMMLDATPMFCAVWNEKGEIIDCNMEGVRLLSFAGKSECVGNFYKAHPTLQKDGMLSRDKIALMINKTLETGFQSFDWEFASLAGEMIPADVTLLRVPFRDTYRILSYARDLREINKANERIEWNRRFLEEINHVASNLIRAEEGNIEQVVFEQLRIIGEITGSNRCCLWENRELDGEMYAYRICDWSSQLYIEDASVTQIKYSQYPYIRDRMFSGEIINCSREELPEQEREILRREGVRATLQFPLVTHNGLWGFLRFDNHINERVLAEADVNILKACGALIASSIIRSRAVTGLVNAKNELTVHAKLLGAVNTVANILLDNRGDKFNEAVQASLRILGECVSSDRVSIWRNFENEEGALYCRRLYGWIAGEEPEQTADGPIVDYASYIPEWDKGMTQRKVINLPMRFMNDKMRSFSILQHSKSLLLIHIEIDGEFWGFIGYSNNDEETELNEAEIGILRSGGMVVASAIIKNETNEQLISATEEALASVRAKNEFLARMSHEIRTPLNAVIGMTTVAQGSDSAKKVEECLEVVSSSSRQLLRIINDVLDMSNMDLGKLALEAKDFCFTTMLHEILHFFSPAMEEKNQNFELDIERPFTRMIKGDKRRLAQVISNLLSNSVKFTPENGNICVRVLRTADYSGLIVKVIDNGIGISDELLPKVFEAFEQAEGGLTRRQGGSGLGLPICKNIISAMGGSISVESSLGSGSCFTVEIPVVWGAPCEDMRSEPDGNAHILVVSDEESELEYLKSTIDSFSYSCHTAASEEVSEVLAKARDENNPYDIVFLECLPGSDIEKKKAEIEHLNGKEPVLIIMSISDRALMADKMKKAGIAHCLTKPLLPSDIFNKLVEITNQAPREYKNEEVSAPSDWSDKRILLVEDVEINRIIAAELLGETNVQIEYAENGEKAVAMVAENPNKYDLILMDVQMPVMDGITAARVIRGSECSRANEIPIYAMTAHTYKEDIDACLEAGMNGHISKPIEISALWDALNDAFGQGGA